MFSRYAEGSGSAAKFNKIRSSVFFSPTKLIIADKDNDCLRLIDFATNPPSTTRFAGTCETSGLVQGQRLSDAQLAFPTSIAISSDNSILYFIDNNEKGFREINLESDEVKLIKTFSEPIVEILFYNNALYAIVDSVKVIKIDVETFNDEIIAGGNLTGNATGLFSKTRLGNVQAFICWPDSQEQLFLATDKINKRFDKTSIQIREFVV